MPIPPSRASAIAMRASVTVSIAAETTGTLSAIVRVSRVAVETSFGSTRRLGRDEQHVVEREPLLAELLGRSEIRRDREMLDVHRGKHSQPMRQTLAGTRSPRAPHGRDRLTSG